MFRYEKKGIEVESDILIFAVRYALGRRSFAPLMVSDAVRDNFKNIRDIDLFGIVADINSKGDNLGDACDIRAWMDLKDDIIKELEMRDYVWSI